jgi:iron complex outermembrane receptor protein
MTFSNRRRTQLLGSAALLGVILMAGAAEAQTVAQPSEVGEVVVTGSRIRRVDTETSAPVSVVGQQDILDRGYANVGEALNKLTSVAPMEPASPGSGPASGSGQQYPNLFNLGVGRTLTLVNGRRAAPSSSGLGDRVVDTNTIPTGLIERVDVVQAGGAAVYGSDAIAGVINYVLKDNFQGFTEDIQYGDTTRNDYAKPSVRITAGTNFAGGRGNIAANLEMSSTPSLLYGSRKITQPVVRALANPRNTSLTDGISATLPVPDPHFWSSNKYGVLFANSGQQSIANLLGFKVTGEQIGGYQFSADGQSVIPYNAGTRYAGLQLLVPVLHRRRGQSLQQPGFALFGRQRYSATGIGHYDLTDHMKLSGELLFAHTKGTDPLGPRRPSTFRLRHDQHQSVPDGLRATLTSLFPAFATGSPLFLGKNFEDLLPTREYSFTNDTYRGVISLDGDFNVGGRDYYYSAFYTRSVVKGKQNSYGVMTTRLANALSARAQWRRPDRLRHQRRRHHRQRRSAVRAAQSVRQRQCLGRRRAYADGRRRDLHQHPERLPGLARRRRRPAAGRHVEVQRIVRAPRGDGQEHPVDRPNSACSRAASFRRPRAATRPTNWPANCWCRSSGGTSPCRSSRRWS